MWILILCLDRIVSETQKTSLVHVVDAPLRLKYNPNRVSCRTLAFEGVPLFTAGFDDVRTRMAPLLSR